MSMQRALYLLILFTNTLKYLPDWQTSCFWYLREGLLLSDFFLLVFDSLSTNV